MALLYEKMLFKWIEIGSKGKRDKDTGKQSTFYLSLMLGFMKLIVNIWNRKENDR